MNTAGFEANENETNAQIGKYLTFILGKETFGLEISSVIEIIGIQKITPVPDMPNFVKGVINLRGKVLPVIDVRLRFGMEARSYLERTCIVVINVKSVVVGLIVDTVCEVLEIEDNQFESTDHFRVTQGNQFMQGIAKLPDRSIILLDSKSLLFQETANFKPPVVEGIDG